MKKALLLPVIPLLMCAAPQAGVVISGEGGGARHEITLGRDSLRFDSGEDASAIFTRKDGKSALLVIDRGSEAYYEIGAEDVRRLKAALEQARRMAEQSLGYLPEDRRKEMEEKMLGLLGPAPAERKTVLEARGERVGSWTADRHALYLDGKKTAVAWHAGFGQFGLSAEDFKVMEEFEKFMEPLASLQFSQGFVFFPAGKSPGVPVKIAEVSGDGSESVVFMASAVEKRKLPPGVFAAPEGLRRMKLPFGN